MKPASLGSKRVRTLVGSLVKAQVYTRCAAHVQESGGYCSGLNSYQHYNTIFPSIPQNDVGNTLLPPHLRSTLLMARRSSFMTCVRQGRALLMLHLQTTGLHPEPDLSSLDPPPVVKFRLLTVTPYLHHPVYLKKGLLVVKAEGNVVGWCW